MSDQKVLLPTEAAQDIFSPWGTLVPDELTFPRAKATSAGIGLYGSVSNQELWRPDEIEGSREYEMGIMPCGTEVSYTITTNVALDFTDPGTDPEEAYGNIQIANAFNSVSVGEGVTLFFDQPAGGLSDPSCRGTVSVGEGVTLYFNPPTAKPAGAMHVTPVSHDTMPSLPPDVREFSTEHQLDEYLDIAVDTARICFQGLLDFGFSKELDPEDDDEWIEMNVILADEENFLLQYREYNRQFVEQTPWPERTMIRLNFEFA